MAAVMSSAAAASSKSTDAMMATTNAQQQQQRGQIPIVCPGHTRPLAELQFLYLPEERRTLLVSACHDKLPMIRDGVSGDWIGTFQGHKGAVWSATLDTSANLAATGSGDFGVKLWDAVTGTELTTLPHGHIVKTCAFSPDSCYLATGGQEGKLRVYALETTLQQYTQQSGAAEKSSNSATTTNEPQWTIAVAGTTIAKVCWLNATTVLAGCGDGKIRVWSVPSSSAPGRVMAEEPMATMDTHTNKEIRDMQITTTGSNGGGATILTVASGKQVLFFDVHGNSPTLYSLLQQHTMPIHFDNEGGACLHPSGKVFLAGGSDLWVRVCDYASGEVLDIYKGHHGPIRCLRYSPDGSSFASGSEDGTIRLWETGMPMGSGSKAAGDKK